jgi:hypothetical protein
MGRGRRGELRPRAAPRLPHRVCTFDPFMSSASRRGAGSRRRSSRQRPRGGDPAGRRACGHARPPRRGVWEPVHRGPLPQGLLIREPGRSLPSLAAELGDQAIELLKLDIEGSEYAVLGLLDSALGAGVLCAELHHTVPPRVAKQHVERRRSLRSWCMRRPRRARASRRRRHGWWRGVGATGGGRR